MPKSDSKAEVEDEEPLFPLKRERSVLLSPVLDPEVPDDVPPVRSLDEDINDKREDKSVSLLSAELTELVSVDPVDIDIKISYLDFAISTFQLSLLDVSDVVSVVPSN